MSFDLDLFVIGAGSGGVRAARVAAQCGARVAVAEEYRVGGTCVIRGCVPKKLMVFASSFPAVVEDARAYGWDASIGSFDWSRFRKALHDELDRLEAIYRANLERAGVTIHPARAVLEDAHTVRLDSGERFTAKHILIATGGAPFIPEIPGRELASTSNDMFLMEELPRSILVVGGGYIACEFACILNSLGVDVTLAYRGPQILRAFDEEVRGHVSAAMRGAGIDIRTETDVAALHPAADGVRVAFADGGQGDYGRVLYATGRVPSTGGLGLEALGVRLRKSGAIAVDEWSQTSVPSIYAVGDVTDRVNLTPVAIREGQAFAETVFHGTPTKADHDLVPSAVFTQPEMAGIGMTEQEGRERGGVQIYSTAFRPMRTLFAGREDRVLMKLVVDSESRRVLGCHIVAPEAGEMIQLAAIAVKMGATKEDFDRTVAVHPTMAEELVTMKAPSRSW
ncbi:MULTISPECIES: glutathione-disulfide reductase [unclassified Haematobacter]|uniref:glutathione-disulfide reductase n=1 Tax=unclassified Haematobacter TaxID=2640585 RepID=UPI0025BCD39F|nr:MULTISPECIES: glutathione-disulfide reductase [unclassified Haematobacter]